MKKNLVLLGMMAVGKTTLGKIVAKKKKFEFIDTDKVIERKHLMSIKEIFEKKGENFFRIEEEKEVIDSLKKSCCVIALGGGAFVNKKIRENVIKKTFSIWLDSSLKILRSRSMNNKNRPLLLKKNIDEIKNIYEQRKKIYKMAHCKIICDGLSKDKIAKKIIELYELQ